MTRDEIDEIDEYTEEVRGAPDGPLLGHGPLREFLKRKRAAEPGPRVAHAALDEGLLEQYKARAEAIGVPCRDLLERALRQWLDDDTILEEVEELIRTRRGRGAPDESAA